MIYIKKRAGKKVNAFRVMNRSSIPVFLKKSVRIINDMIILDCVEGEETCTYGAVIGYEKSDRVDSGWNCWVIGNAETALEERDEGFYTKPVIVKAELISEKSPDFIKNADIKYIENESAWTVNASWGVLKGEIGRSYWLLYGENNGKPDVGILSVSEKSFDQYFVCDEKGEIISSLREEYNCNE